MKEKQFHIRVSEADKSLIEAAAKAQEMTVAEFIRRAAIKAAEKVVGDE